jgi:DNA primase
LADKHHQAMTDAGYQYLSDQLGVSVDSLRRLHVGWDGSQSLTTWPMRNAEGRIVGVRTRAADNEKRSVSGSDGNGLFYVPDLLTADHLLICEGPSDTAAMLDCGYGSTIGRPSCRLGNAYTIEIIERLKPSAVLLIPDRDQAGLTGFADLAAAIAKSGCIEMIRIDAITPPPGISDAREWAKKSREHLRGRIAGSLDNITKRTEGIS